MELEAAAADLLSTVAARRAAIRGKCTCQSRGGQGQVAEVVDYCTKPLELPRRLTPAFRVHIGCREQGRRSRFWVIKVGEVYHMRRVWRMTRRYHNRDHLSASPTLMDIMKFKATLFVALEPALIKDLNR